MELFADARQVVHDRRTWTRIRRFLSPFRTRLVALVLVCAGSVATTLVQPFLFRSAIDSVVRGEVSGLSWTDAGPSLAVDAVLVGVIGAIGVAFGFAEQRLHAVITEGVSEAARDHLVDAIQHKPYPFFVHANPGALVDRVIWEPAAAGAATSFVVAESTKAALIIGASSLLVVAFDVRLALVLAAFGLVLLPSRWIRRRIRVAMVDMVVVHGRYSGLLQERLSVSGASMTRVFGLYGPNRAQLADLGRRRRDLAVGAETLQGASQSLVLGSLTLGLVAIIWFGGKAVSAGTMTIGGLALLLFYVRIVAMPFQSYGQLRFELLRGMLAYGRLFELIPEPADGEPVGSTTRSAPTDPHGRTDGADDRTDGTLQFEHVSFRYPDPRSIVPISLSLDGFATAGSADDAPVVHDLSFEIPAGSFVALAGASGAGKSTVAALASGLVRPTSGTVRVGGVAIDGLDHESRRAAVGLVSQDAHLIHDSIRANLLLARPDATDKELVRACATAGIHRFVRSLPNGYGTVVGERGVRLSGGQRQRLAFARVLLLDPAVVILDEATAHLDAESEALLREAVSEVLAARTRLVIAHRLSTIVDADEILVLDDGRLVERGRHGELMAADGRYAALYRTQLVVAEPEPPPTDSGLVAAGTEPSL